MRPLRILHVIWSLQPGGAEHGLVKLICSLTPPQFRHAVLCIQTAGPLANHLPAHVPVSIAHTVNPLRAGLDVAELAQRFRPDVIHSLNCCTWPAAVIGQQLSRRPRLVWSFHGWDDYQPVTRKRAATCRFLAPRTHRLGAVSSAAADLLCRQTRLPRHRFDILPNGVDCRRFIPRPSSDPSLAQHNTFRIAAVGRLATVKDWPTLLRAIALMPAQARDRITVDFIGAGPQRPDLEVLARQLALQNNVRFLGYRDDLPHRLPHYHALALTSRREGSPNVVLEAMACALPVVATAVGALPELLQDGRCGLLAPPAQPAALARQLLRLYEDPNLCHSLGQAARQRALAHYRLDQMVRAYAAFFHAAARQDSEVAPCVE